MTSFATRLLPSFLRQRSLTRNVVLSWATAVTYAAIALVVTPVLVRQLQREAYGVWTFLNSLTLYSNLLYVGLGAALLKRMSEAAGRRDAADGTRLFGVTLTIYSLLGLVCLVATMLGRSILPGLLARPLPPELQDATRTVIALLGVRLACMFVSSAFSAHITAHGRWDLGAIVMIALALLRTGGVLWAAYQPDALVKIAAISVLETALQIPIFALICRAIAPEVAFRPALPSPLELKQLYGFGAQAFVVQVAILVIFSTDLALIGVLLGAGAVGVYALPLQLVEHSRLLVNGVTQNLLPELSARRARGEMDQVSHMFLLASRACATLSSFVNVHLVLLGPAFLTLWVGPDLAAESPRILLCLGIAATAAAISTQAMTPVYMAMDLVRVLLVIVIAEAAVNFALSYWLAHAVGLWGVALATAIPAVAITLLFAPRPLLTRLQVPFAHFVAYVFGPAAMLTVASVATQLLLARWHTVTSFFDLALRVAASTIVCAGIVLATFERADLPGPLRRFSLR